MTNRREFLHMGVAALSLPIAARAGISAAAPSDESAPQGSHAPTEPVAAEPLYKILFDERFPASTSFADELKRHGLTPEAIRGDITDVWFNDLYYRWKQQPVAIAGLTAPGAIFCLEMLARDAGMQVVMRADHRFSMCQTSNGARVEHEVWAPGNAVAKADALRASGEHWPTTMAEMVMRFPAHREAHRKAKFSAPAPIVNGNTEHLVTWVIAPQRRA
jgi:hypothetical protein